MNAPPDARPDIRKGDLIKATRKTDPEEYRQGRVVRLIVDGVVFTSGLAIDLNHYDIEVLDRPLPAIDEELLRGARQAYVDRARSDRPDAALMNNDFYDANLTAVINYVRQNDTHIKENAK